MTVGSPEIQEHRPNQRGKPAREPSAISRIFREVTSLNSPLRIRLARGAFWSVLNTGFTRLSSLVIAILVARTVGKEQFGQFGVIQGTVGVFGLFAGLGISLTATRYVAELREADRPRTGRILGLSILLASISSLLVCAGLVVVAPRLATTTLASREVGPLLQIGSGLLLFGVINGALSGALSGFEEFRAVAFVDIAAALFSCVFAGAGLRRAGLPGAIVGLVGADALQCIGYCLYLKRQLRHSGIALVFHDCLREWPVIAKFSVPALLAAAMAAPVNWICSVILVNQPSGYAEMGLFNAANQWRSVVLMLPMTVSAPFLPVLTSLFGKEHGKYFKVLWAGIILNTVLALGTAAGLFLLARPIMAAYGRGFAGGSDVLVWLVFSAVIAAATWTVGQAITSSGRMWWGFGLNLVWAAVLISSLWMLRGRGAFGYAVAMLIAYSVHGLTSAYVYHRVHAGVGAADEAVGATSAAVAGQEHC